MNRDNPQGDLTRTADPALNEAVACLNGTNPTPNEIGIVAVMIQSGTRPDAIRQMIVRARGFVG